MNSDLWHITPCVRIFDGERCVGERSSSGVLGGARWEAKIEREALRPGAELVRVRAEVVDGRASAASAGAILSIPGWSTSQHLLIPGAIYAGNRFESHPATYSPRPDPKHKRPDPPTFIADIPRLSQRGASRIELLAGATATPAVAAYDKRIGTAWIIQFPVFAGSHELGLDFRESEGGASATLRVTAPGVRERRYRHMCSSAESPDRGAAFERGQCVMFPLVLHHFACDGMADLFRKLFEVRTGLCVRSRPAASISLSAAAQLVEEHYNRDMWWEEEGLYRTDVRPSHPSIPYQTGWCGGVIAQYALLASGTGELTRSRCKRHLNKALTEGISPSGLFYGRFAQGKWLADGHAEPHENAWRQPLTLIRRQGDALLYALKAFETLERQGEIVPEAWLSGARGVAEALARIWKRHGQFGQWVDQFTGELVIGNSACGAIIPASLVAAHRRFGGDFLAVAAEAAQFLHEHFTARGITTGGPGDALQAPDSESAYALVVSFMDLFDATRGREWLERAKEAAHQFASWVIAYDYRFPDGSHFAHRGVNTAGAVIANAQNTHGAPGICTHSGEALHRIARACGDARFSALADEIVSVLTQCISTADHPVIDRHGDPLPPGWINERVNTNDWDDNSGGVFHGPCWCEVSLLLSHAELPENIALPQSKQSICDDYSLPCHASAG